MLDFFALIICLSFVVSVIAITIDMMTHDDFPELYDDEL